MSIEDELKRLGLELPTPPTPVGSYIPGRIDGDHLWTSGQTARINGTRRYVGKVGSEVTVEDAQASSRDAMLNCLAVIKLLAGSLDRVDHFVKVVGYVNGVPGFTRQADCLNGASELVIALYGDRGYHARSAVGVADLPYGASIELDVVLALRQEPHPTA